MWYIGKFGSKFGYFSRYHNFSLKIKSSGILEIAIRMHSTTAKMITKTKWQSKF